MARRLLALLTSLALVAPPSLLAQAPTPADLEKGIEQTREGDYEAAIATLQGVIKRLSALGGRDLARAYLYLGVAHRVLDQESQASADFQAALKADPTLVLSASEFPPALIKALDGRPCSPRPARRQRSGDRPLAAKVPPVGHVPGSTCRHRFSSVGTEEPSVLQGAPIPGLVLHRDGERTAAEVFGHAAQTTAWDREGGLLRLRAGWTIADGADIRVRA